MCPDWSALCVVMADWLSVRALERKTQWGREAEKKVGRRSVFLAVLGRGQNSRCKLSPDDRTMGEEAERNSTREHEAREQRETFYLQPCDTNNPEPQKLANTPGKTNRALPPPNLPLHKPVFLLSSGITHNHPAEHKITKEKVKSNNLPNPFPFLLSTLFYSQSQLQLVRLDCRCCSPGHTHSAVTWLQTDTPLIERRRMQNSGRVRPCSTKWSMKLPSLRPSALSPHLHSSTIACCSISWDVYTRYRATTHGTFACDCFQALPLMENWLTCGFCCSTYFCCPSAGKPPSAEFTNCPADFGWKGTTSSKRFAQHSAENGSFLSKLTQVTTVTSLCSANTLSFIQTFYI